jgi:hypothetical protein
MAATRSSRVGTNADGGVDVDDLRAKADDQVACLMLTNPTRWASSTATSRRSRRSSTASARRSTTTGRTSTP